MQAIGYVRCSTREQTDSGLTIEIQRAQIERWARDHHARLVRVFADEGVSGGVAIDKRPGLLAALEAVHQDSVLVVAKRDRLARDAFLAAWLEKEVGQRRGRILSLAGEGTDGDNPADQLMRRLVDAFSEYERSVIRARTRTAMQHKRRNGQRVGTVPYGYDLADDGITLIENVKEQSVITDIGAMRAGGATFTKIAAELGRRNVRTKAGRATWEPQTVRRILARQGSHTET